MVTSIHQPNFFPWYGYFHKIVHSDNFIFFDNVQLPRGKSFVSRTNIIIAHEKSWLTVPIFGKSELKTINEILIDNSLPWKKKHLKTLEVNYKRSPYFDEVFNLITNCYSFETDKISEFNSNSIKLITQYLGVNVNFYFASNFECANIENTGEYIVDLLDKTKTRTYISGTGEGSKKHLNKELFKQMNINLLWQSVSNLNYQQFNSKIFESHLSVIDLLFNQGKNSLNILKSLTIQ